MYFYIKQVLVYFLLILCYKNDISVRGAYYMKSNEVKTYNPRNLQLRDRKIQIYCYEGRPKNVVNLFQTVSLQLKLDNENYVQYDGHTPEEVLNEYEARRSSWSPNIFTWKQKFFKLDPFNQSCIGIDSDEEYSVFLHVIRIDYWKVLILATGVLLFFSGPKLSNNTLFYYICGVTLGICASFLILIYFISKLFPTRPMMYGFVAGGWAVGIYVLQILWENVRVILTNYSNYVLYYMIATGFISFILCYRMGPPTNPRSKNLIKWALQSAGLVCVFNSSHYQEAAMGLVVLLLIAYNFPRSWLVKSKTYWKRKFPPKVRLLSNDEYYQQGVKETNKALSELKKYCSSPECNQWKTVLKLKNAKRYNGNQIVYRNNRFASFVEGNSHLSDQEVLEYENDSIHRTELTDDDDEIDQITDDSENEL